MKPRYVLLSLAVAAAVGALLWWVIVRTPDVPEGAIAVPSTEVGAQDGRRPAARAAGDSDAPASDDDAASPIVAEPGDAAAPTPRAHAASIARDGPAPMSADNAQRVAGVIARMRQHDPHLDDLLTLLENEGRDDVWSDAAEAQLAAFLRTHGARHVDLEVLPPRCSATVCEMVAVAKPGLGTDVASADWQRLLADLYGQDWFGAVFVDPRMGMTIDAGSVVYVTTLLRADPPR